MNIEMKTATSIFIDPTEETIEREAFGIIWDNGVSNPKNDRVVSPFGWRLKPAMHGAWGLRDKSGETRFVVRWGEYHSAIEFPDWAAYDADIKDRRLVELQMCLDGAQREIGELKSYNFQLKTTLAEVYDANSAGGPGSRKLVKELILGVGVRTCNDCGRAICLC